uniref:Leucine rich repeat containing 71 n=1 Tax=Chelonoidis abingdonii TaxID=106734 RepID=A0A8C0IXY4_CHEAB
MIQPRGGGTSVLGEVSATSSHGQSKMLLAQQGLWEWLWFGWSDCWAALSPEEYQCTGILEQDFNELCSRAGLTKIPKVTVRLHDMPAEKEVPASLTQIQSKYAYFRPCIQTELEHDDPKSVREIFLRGWKIEEKMLGVFSKCLPALANLQAVQTLTLEGNPLAEGSFYRLIGEESTVAHVSLRNNNIGDADAKLIGQALSTLKSSNKSLVSLTLSFNNISDLGAGYIAEGLRLNRSLLCLSLAHNQIGDQGAHKLAEVLGPFALTHTEVVERRRLLLEKESQERSRSVRLLPGHAHPPEGNRSIHFGGGGVTGCGVAGGDATSELGTQPVGGAPVAQLTALRVVSTPDQKAVRGKGTKSGTKEKRSLPPELEVLEPTEIMNPLLEQAEHRDGKVFLPGNRVLINLNLTCTSAWGPGLAGNPPSHLAGQVLPFAHSPPFLRFQKNRFPADSKTFAKLQELMLPRDPTYRQLPKAPEEELAAPS